MFGYILPEKPEMKIKDYELFRAYYCGVCKSIGRRLGQIPRLTLNYDSTFMAVFLSAFRTEKPEIKRERCIAHPLKKRSIIRNNPIVDYAADMNILLAYLSLRDHWKDEGSLLSLGGMAALKSNFEKLKKKHKEKCGIIESRLAELTGLEKEGCCSMDRAAEPFAKILEELMDCSLLNADENKRNALRWVGYNMGKWIYLLDAYDDIDKDIKNKAYNPLLCQYGYEGGDAGKFKAGIGEQVEFNLVYSLSEMAKACELLEIRNNRGIIENIIYMGMLRKTEQILKTGSCIKIEKSV